MNPLKSGLALGALGAVMAAGAVTAPMASALTTAASGPSVRPAVAAAQARAGDTARALRLDSREQLKVKDVVTDRDGGTHVRYERTFAGLRVIGGDFVVHRTAAGAVRTVTWNASGRADVASTTPRVAAATARATGARTAPLARKAAAGELVVYAGGKTPRLAYDVLVTGIKADQTPTRLHTVVDATTGATLARWDDIEQGSGQGIFVGKVSVGSTLSGSSYLLKDTVGNYTTDLKQATSGTGTQFTDADDVWGNGTVSDRASAAVDAQYGAEKTFDYYKNVQGRNGIKNDGVGARSRVHYGSNYENAFWDGTQMTYGDGASNTHPLVELDVAAHEMSHGVTENTAGLAYTGDAGGLNEATSDIFGTAVEFYAANAGDPGDYLIGEEIDLNGNGTPLRYMDKPSRDGASKDCWSSSLGSLDPHYSSGPLNHWFYLASEGSGAKTINGTSYNSPTCDGSTVTGHRPGQGGQDLVPHPLDVPHLLEHLRRGAQRGDQVRQGPVRRLQRRVHGRCRRLQRDRGPGRLGDLQREHHPAAHRQQPAGQPRLRVRCGELGRHRRARSRTTAGARRTAAAGRPGSAATARRRPRPSPSR